MWPSRAPEGSGSYLPERYYTPRPLDDPYAPNWLRGTSVWWEKNEADLSRRAAQLPW